MSKNNLDLNKDLILYILKISTIYNAVYLGWNVKQIDYKTFELTKKISNINTFDLDTFINQIVSMNMINK